MRNPRPRNGGRDHLRDGYRRGPDRLTCDAHFAKLPGVIYVPRDRHERPSLLRSHDRPRASVRGVGPAIGGALFIPLSVAFKAPTNFEAIGVMVLVSTVFGHVFGMIAAYIVGVGRPRRPAFFLLLWDALPPSGRRARCRRSHRRTDRLWPPVAPQPVWASFEMTVRTDIGSAAGDWVDVGRVGYLAWPCVDCLRSDCGFVSHRRETPWADHAAGTELGGRLHPPARAPEVAEAAAPAHFRRKTSRGRNGGPPATACRLRRTGSGAQDLGVFIHPRSRGARRSIMCCSSDRPDFGKTTLAQIVARELGVNFHSTSGPVIAKAGDLAGQLTNLEPRDVLFIDEIHRLNPAIEEILYPAMEDFQLDLIIGAGPAARSVKIDLARSP